MQKITYFGLFKVFKILKLKICLLEANFIPNLSFRYIFIVLYVGRRNSELNIINSRGDLYHRVLWTENLILSQYWEIFPFIN